MKKTNLILIGIFLIILSGVLAATLPTNIMPQSFYGNINNLTAGSTITATISGTTVGTFTLTQNNVYGGASANDDKLAVCGGGESVCSSGATISFSCTGGSISETTTFTPGAITNLDLTCTPSPAEAAGAAGTIGGDGGAAAAEEAAAEASESKMWGSVEAGKENVMVIDNELIPISKITFVTNKGLTNVEVIVNSYTTKPSAVEAVPSSKSPTVYKYIEIVPKNIKKEDLTKVNIEFDVTLSWLNENNADTDDVILLRFSNKWTELTTNFISKDTVNAYYKAVTPGFSYFAIGLKPKIVEKPVEEVPEEEVPEEEILPEVIEKKAPIGWIIAAAIVVIGLIIYFQVTKKKKK